MGGVQAGVRIEKGAWAGVVFRFDQSYRGGPELNLFEELICLSSG